MIVTCFCFVFSQELYFKTLKIEKKKKTLKSFFLIEKKKKLKDFFSFIKKKKKNIKEFHLINPTNLEYILSLIN